MLNTLNDIKSEEFLTYLNLSTSDKYQNLPLEVVTTGLPYLVVPVKSNVLSKIKVTIGNLEEKLNLIGAKFFYVIDIDKSEGRTWDNLGLVEDVATGSAAGPEPSHITVIASGLEAQKVDMNVSGDIIKIANGKIITATNTV